MAYDENNFEIEPEGEEIPEEEGNNKTFMIMVGVLGGLILLSVACLAGFYLFSNASNTQQAAAAAANATQTEVAKQIIIRQALTATANAAQPTATLSPTPTNTPLMAPPSPTSTPEPGQPQPALDTNALTQAAITSTVGASYAALTKAAIDALSATPFPTPTRLAGTGFADEYGLPGLVVMALAFIVVILFARRLRTSPTAR